MASRIVRSAQPCPCGRSSDAYTVYDDGHGYCFSGSCPKPYHQEGQAIEGQRQEDATSKLPIIKDETLYTYEHLAHRGLTRETTAFYGILFKIDPFGKPDSIGFPYGIDGWKTRGFDEKRFTTYGQMGGNEGQPLFGMDRFSAGSAKSITITEGEFDAASVYQMLGSRYPAVSVRSSSSARKDCERARDYLNSFERIYLAFDNDEAGQRAVKQVAVLFDFNKVYHVKLSKHKDANAYLQATDEEEFRKVWHNSNRFLPEGIISGLSAFDTIIDEAGVKEGTPYPFRELQELTYGIRTGEVVLFTAMEGIGKTEVIRAIEFHLLNTTDANIGVIHLEESKDRLLKGLAGYQLQTPVHLPDSHVSNDGIKQALRSLLKKDDRLHIYSHFGSSDPNVILDTIRFLVTACGCKYIFLDHITMVVSGLSEDDERKTLDYISTRLAMMVEELDFALILVSHVNDSGQTRGSRNISKIADLWVHLNRDKSASTETERNTTYLDCRKNRFGARTGPGGVLYFDLGSFMVSDTPPDIIVLPPTGE